MFADDTNIFYSTKDPKELELTINTELSNVINYCNANKLSINFKKTNYMIIASPRKNVDITITACNIERKNTIKYLGIYIDNHLKWKTHIQHIKIKISKNLGIIYKLRYLVSITLLKQLYYSLIYPYISYGIMSWGTACQTRLQTIKRKQNKCLRAIFFAPMNESATPFYQLLEIHELNSIFEIKDSTLVYKLRNSHPNLPSALSNLISVSSHVHNHNTRLAVKDNLHRPVSRTNYGLSRFAAIASKIWEKIPFPLKKLPFQSFLKQIKRFYLNS